MRTIARTTAAVLLTAAAVTLTAGPAAALCQPEGTIWVGPIPIHHWEICVPPEG